MSASDVVRTFEPGKGWLNNPASVASGLAEGAGLPAGQDDDEGGARSADVSLNLMQSVVLDDGGQGAPMKGVVESLERLSVKLEEKRQLEKKLLDVRQEIRMIQALVPRLLGEVRNVELERMAAAKARLRMVDDLSEKLGRSTIT